MLIKINDGYILPSSVYLILPNGNSYCRIFMTGDKSELSIPLSAEKVAKIINDALAGGEE